LTESAFPATASSLHPPGLPGRRRAGGPGGCLAGAARAAGCGRNGPVELRRRERWTRGGMNGGGPASGVRDGRALPWAAGRLARDRARRPTPCCARSRARLPGSPPPTRPTRGRRPPRRPAAGGTRGRRARGRWRRRTRRDRRSASTASSP